MEIDTKVDLDKILKQKLTPQQQKELDNAKVTLEKKLEKEGLTTDELDKLLKPLDLKDPKAQYFISQLEGIQYDRLTMLTMETGLQLDYTALIPVIIKKAKEENVMVKCDEIRKLRQTAIIVKEKLNIKPNYLELFLIQLADELEVLAIKQRRQEKIDRIFKVLKENKILILSVLFFCLVIIFVNKNKDLLSNLQ